MTTQELITLTDSLYPNAESDTVKVAYMNIAIRSLSPYFGIIKEDDSLVTVADQDNYALPSGIDDVSQILMLAIGDQASPTTRYNYTRYNLSARDDNPVNGNSYWQIVDSDGTKKLAIYPEPTTADLPIVIRYQARLAELSATSLSTEPEFDSYYHDMLAFYCAHAICASGVSADRSQADMFMQKYDDRYEELRRFDMVKKVRQKNQYRDNRHWTSGRSTGVGY